MNKKTISAVIVIVAVIAIIIFVSSKNKSQSNSPIKIAALLSLTGDTAAWGENAHKAIELATDEINQSGGIKGRQVDVIYEDTAGDPKKTVSAYQLVTSVDHVTAILGPLNQSELSAIIPLIDQDGTPTVAPDYIPLQNRKDLHNPILVWMDAQVEAGRLAQYVYGQGIRNVGVIGTLDPWESTVSNAFADKFKSLGGTITDTEIVQSDVTDMKLPVTKVMASKPQAIFLGTYYQFVNSTKELHDLGYQGKLFGIEVDDYLAGQTAGWVSDLKFIAPDYYTSGFIADFKNKYGSTPGLPAGQSYDAANILFSFLKESTDQSGILQQMKNFSKYDGVSGQVQVDPQGRTILPTALFQLKGGKVERISGLL